MTKHGVIFDLDGVIWHGDRPVDGAADAIAALRRMGLRVAFCTNNATLHRRDVAAKLTRLGVSASESDVATSGSLAAALAAERWGEGPVYLIGEQGLRSELSEAGLREAEDGAAAKAVILGLDRDFTFAKAKAAHRAILGGAHFLATNPDVLLPETDGGSCPGAGGLIALLETSTGVRAECHGKPSPRLFEAVAHAWGVDAGGMVAVGDRIATDVVAANRFGCVSALVLTGVTTRAEAEAQSDERRPGVIVETLDRLVELLAAGAI